MSSSVSSVMPVPVPKPRARYKRNGSSSDAHLSTEREFNGDVLDAALSPGTHRPAASAEHQASFNAPSAPVFNGSISGSFGGATPLQWDSLQTPGSSAGPSAPLYPSLDTSLSAPAYPTLSATDPVVLSSAISDGSSDESPPSSPATTEDPYIAVLPSWGAEQGSDSSNEDEYGAPVPPSTRPVQSITGAGPNSVLPEQPRSGLVPCRAAPPPPVNHPREHSKPLKQKTPRAATIRVSRRRQGAAGSQGDDSSRKGSVVSRSSWLDVWKGRKHNVLWATFDGQLMSLWKKRTDKFTEVAFHVSSITSVRKQDKGRFSVFFRKKHFEFMGHNEVVQEGWVNSLLASRGQQPPGPLEHHGPLTMKDPRSKVFAAVWGHKLWVYNTKEDYQLGVGMLYVSMNVASVKQTSKHGFSLITPYRTFNFSADSSKDLASWLGCLSNVIRSALSCSEVALRLWASPWNKVCADCGSANPEWASVNLLVVICEDCAGQHRSLGTAVSKVRSLKMDSKVWTEPLIQLFIHHGNKAANSVWSPSVPAAEQILPDSSPEQRARFISAKYTRGCYRRHHPLASSQMFLNQRLCEVVCGKDVGETLSLLCSGAKVLCQSGDPQCPSPILLAERAGQALQIELLRHNEYTEVPPYQQRDSRKNLEPSSASGNEELHGKLEEDRFLFSLENDAAACDVMDLREVISVFLHSSGQTHEFEAVTLTDKLLCSADTHETLLFHLLHILKVVIPGSVAEEELAGVLTASRVHLREGEGLQYTEAWAAIQSRGVIISPCDASAPVSRLPLGAHTQHKKNSSDRTVELVAGERTLSLRFEREDCCESWHATLVSTLRQRPSLYQLLPSAISGKVPPGVERCISHVTQYGLKVDGIYRRCGMATKVSHLVEALKTLPSSARLEADEQGVLDAAVALKQYVREQDPLIPLKDRELWVKAAAIPDETVRMASYRSLLRRLPADNRVTLGALCGHFYLVQMFSGENRMTGQNLALVFVPTLFLEMAMNTDLVRLTRELIIHHTLIFLSKEDVLEADREEQMTVL